MHGRTDLDAAFGGHATGEAQHFRAVRLHLEIPQRARVGAAAAVQRPAEARVQLAGQLGMVDDSVGPAPELAIRLVVGA